MDTSVTQAEMSIEASSRKEELTVEGSMNGGTERFMMETGKEV